MTASNIISQSPKPKIEIINYQTGNNFFIQLELQSYNWQLSVNDMSGSFNISLFPENSKNKENYFDKINVLDIVKIYECSAEKNMSTSVLRNQKQPVFIGIVKSKKYASQATDLGGVRRISITGTSIAGLIADFNINFDTTALALTDKLLNNSNIVNSLTTSMTGDSSNGQKLKDIIKKIYESFLDISSQLGTVKVNEIINKYMGNNFFDCDDKYTFKYSLGSVFRGETNQNFFNVIDGLIPPPIYEKFSYIDSNGLMKIKIRECPFSSEDWDKIKTIKLSPIQIKAIDLEESSKDVYTVFFAYLNGYPMSDVKLARIAAQKDEGIDNKLAVADEKFSVYGYKPLFAHLIGYSKPSKKDDTDATCEDSLKEITQQIKTWYENVDQMLKGSITLAMSYQDKLIMPGDKVSFVGCDFYVEGVSHSWNYGAGGDINISVSRGGKYSGGKWSKAKNFTSKIALLESGTDK